MQVGNYLRNEPGSESVNIGVGGAGGGGSNQIQITKRKRRLRRQGTGGSTGIGRTVSPDLRDLDFGFRSLDGREGGALQLGFDEEPLEGVADWQLLFGGDVSRIGRSGPLATPVLIVIIGSLRLTEAGSGEQDRSNSDQTHGCEDRLWEDE